MGELPSVGEEPGLRVNAPEGGVGWIVPHHRLPSLILGTVKVDLLQKIPFGVILPVVATMGELPSVGEETQAPPQEG